jgi:hypothetical protein
MTLTSTANYIYFHLPTIFVTILNYIREVVLRLDLNPANYSIEIDHVFGKRMNYQYQLSETLVIMSGPNPEENHHEVSNG